MEKIILIVRHGFDNMENYNPEVTTIVGFAETEEDAQHYINEKMKNIVTYHGWDGKTYPYFTTEQVSKVK